LLRIWYVEKHQIHLFAFLISYVGAETIIGRIVSWLEKTKQRVAFYQLQAGQTKAELDLTMQERQELC
jgi:hypothetical protein